MEEYYRYFCTWSGSQISLSQPYNLLVYLFGRFLEHQFLTSVSYFEL